MGISGLLPFLERATTPCHVSEFRGATCAIDAYCWIHRGATACAVQLAQGEDSDIYVRYCLKLVKMLQTFDIRPILVFDGRNLPAKADTEANRRESRKKAKQRAAELLRLGKTDEARAYLKQSINITPNMASEVIKECHKINVDCIVAPYESDAQLAFFSLKGIAEIVITEDSDLLLFGCSKVLFKLDMFGNGYLVDASKIPEAMKLRPDKYTFDKFLFMCILSGCDYIKSLQGIGLKRAQKFITLIEETNPEIFLGRLPRYLNMRCLKITDEYKENFLTAVATFRHQTVFDPFKRKLVPLTDPAVCGTNPKHCKNAGEIFNDEEAYQIAMGNLHPTTLKRLDNWSPSVSSSSIWSGVYKKSESRREQKAKFKEFFKPADEKKEELIDDEQAKIEEDFAIAKELAFYSRKSVEPKRDSTNDDVKVKDVETSPPTSPIIGFNPFSKKRLSKFQLTDTSDSKVIVKSRYFASNVTQVLDTEKESFLDDLETEMDVEEKETEMDVKENVPCNGNSDVETAISDSEEKDSQNYSIKDLSDGIVDFTLSEPDRELVVDKKTTDISASSWPQMSGDSGNLKRKMLQPCRSLGLKRPKSAKQTTLFTFFDKIKKDN